MARPSPAAHTQAAHTQANHRLPVARNLLERRFSPYNGGALNQAWCGDITYIATAEGWLYLATVQDLFSRRIIGTAHHRHGASSARRIIGWSLGESLEADLVCDAGVRCF